MGISWLFKLICFLFCVTTDAYLAHFNKIWFLGILVHQTLYISFFLCVPTGGAVGLKMASKKPLLVVNVFSDFSIGTALWVPHSYMARAISKG